MRDLMIDFGDGCVRPLLEVTDIEFKVLDEIQAAKCLVLDIVELPGQDVEARFAIERIVRGKRNDQSQPIQKE